MKKCAYYLNKLRQSVSLEIGLWRQIMTSQTAHTKYKYDYLCHWMKTPPWKFSAYATVPAKQQLAFCSNDRSSISSNRGNYVELLHTLAAKDERLARPGVSNIRSADQNRPVARLNPARGMIS